MELLKKSKLFAVLVFICLVGLGIWIYSNILFVFRPLEAIFASVFLPVLISVFIFYIFLPFFNLIKKEQQSTSRSLCHIASDPLCCLFNHSGDRSGTD